MIRSGLVGRSIMASRSPWLHEQEARAQGLELSYELFDLDASQQPDEALPTLVGELEKRRFSGFNVTYPFKQAIMPLLDELDKSAELVGAVNTVVIRDGHLVGHNTDMEGFRSSLLEGLPGVSFKRVLQLGAGGAGSATAVALLSLGTRHLNISDLNRARAEALSARLSALWPEADIALCDGAVALSNGKPDGIVNSTPMGMAAKPAPPIDMALLDAGQWVADIVYFPLETQLLGAARDKGCRTLNGSGMVIHQAALAFELITGHAADASRMRDTFLAES